MSISKEHRAELRYASQLLEKPSLAAKLTDKVGAPLEKGMSLLPENWSQTIQDRAFMANTGRCLQRGVVGA